MIGYLIEGKLIAPNLNETLALHLLLDDSRAPADKPDLPYAVPLRFWHATNLQTLNTLIDNDISNQDLPSLFEDLEDNARELYAASLDGEEPGVEHTPPRFYTQAAATTLHAWHTATNEWRKANPSDTSKHLKLVSLLTKGSESAAHIFEYHMLPEYQQYYVVTQLNADLWSFLTSYIGTGKHRHLITESLPNNGLDLLRILDKGRINPSIQAGASILAHLQTIRMHPGTSWDQFHTILLELEDDYFQATDSKFPSSLMRLALTSKRRLQSFYEPVCKTIETREAVGHPDLPLTAPGDELSVASLMASYQLQNPDLYKRYLRKTRRTRPDAAQAHMAEPKRPSRPRPRQPQRGKPNNRRTNPSSSKTFNCTWCKKHRPDCPTSHYERECRIKKDCLRTACDICQQIGHPAKFCPNSTGRAHNCEETKQQPNCHVRPPVQLTRHGFAHPEDELNAAEAQRAIKNAHDTLKARGVNGARFKVIYLDEAEHS